MISAKVYSFFMGATPFSSSMALFFSTSITLPSTVIFKTSTPGGIKVLKMSDEEDAQQPTENTTGYQSAYWEGQDSNGPPTGLQDIPINSVPGLFILPLPLLLI